MGIHVAQTRGKLLKGSALDIPSAARAVIQDWTAGRFRYFVMPPAISEGSVAAVEAETAEVVQSLAPALDIDALLNANDGDEDMDGGATSKPVVLGAPLLPGMGDDTMECDGEGSGMVQVDM